MRDRRPSRTAAEDFFLPDVCAVQPLLLLIVVSQLVAILVVLAGSSLAGFDWNRFALVSFFALWVAVASAWLLCRLRPYLAALPGAAGAAAAYALVLAVAALVSAGSRMFLRQQFGLQAEDWPVMATQLLMAAIVTGIMFRYLYLQQQLNRQQQAELRARLDALQARIHPHFLFNSMNIIASLIATRPAAAEQAVEDLAELFRASLARADTEVTLVHELALCRRYLALEGLRLGERLQVEWDTDAVPETLPIPLLTLQPLLENAIVHGIQPRVDGGTVRIGLQYRTGRLEIRVSNPLPDGEVGMQGGNRMALSNIRDRLHNLYGDSVVLRLDCSENLAVAYISYPVREQPA